MRKWIAIRTSAAIAIAGGICTLLLSVLMAGALMWTTPREGGPLPGGVLKVAGLALSLLFACCAVWSIATGIGVFRRRAWARMSMVFFAGLLAFFGGTGAVVMLALPFLADAGGDPRAATFIRSFVGAFYGIVTLVGVWWLVLFNRPTAREYFSEAAAQPGPGRPLSISVLGWYLLVNTVLTALGAVLRVPTPLFGFLLNGWAPLLLLTACTAIQVYLGAGLLELDEKARVWSIAYFCAAAINGVVVAFSPALLGRLQESALKVEGISRLELPPFPRPWVLALASLACLTFPVWFLVRRRAAFATAAGPRG